MLMLPLLLLAVPGSAREPIRIRDVGLHIHGFPGGFSSHDALAVRRLLMDHGSKEADQPEDPDPARTAALRDLNPLELARRRAAAAAATGRPGAAVYRNSAYRLASNNVRP